MHVADLVCQALIEAGFEGTCRGQNRHSRTGDDSILVHTALGDGIVGHLTTIAYNHDYLYWNGVRFELGDPDFIDALINRITIAHLPVLINMSPDELTRRVSHGTTVQKDL